MTDTLQIDGLSVLKSQRLCDLLLANPNLPEAELKERLERALKAKLVTKHIHRGEVYYLRAEKVLA